MMNPCITIITCITALFMACQAYGNGTLNDSLLIQAQNRLKAGEYDETITLATIILDRSEKTKDWKTFYRSGSEIVKSLRRSKRPEAALDSIASWVKRIPPDQHTHLGRLFFREGSVYRSMGRMHESILAYNRSILHLHEAKDSSLFFVLYNNISINYARLNDYRVSRNYAFLALKNYKDNPKLISKRKNLILRIAQTYLWDDMPKKALEALQFYESLYGTLNDKGQILKVDFLIADGKITLAEQLLAKMNPKPQSYEVLEVNMNLSKAKENYEEAFQWCKVMISQVDRTYTDREYMRDHVRLAELYSENERYEVSDSILETVLPYYGIEMNKSSKEASTGMAAVDPWGVKSLYILAKNTLNNKETLNEKRLNIALNYVELAMQIRGASNHALITNHSKYKLGEEGEELVSLVTKILRALWNEKRDTGLLERAFVLSQYANASILRGAVSTHEILESCPLPDSLFLEWLNTKEALGHSNSDSLEETLLRFMVLEEEIRRVCPTYKHIENYPVASIDEIQSSLDRNERWIKYQELDDEYYVYVITKKESHWGIIQNKADINKKIDSLVQLLSHQNKSASVEDKFIKSAQELYQKLVLPFISAENRPVNLYIVAEGNLQRLPFDMLINKRTESWIDRNAYLLNDYIISYFYYSGQFILEKTNSQNENEFAAFGINYSEEYFDDLANQYRSSLSRTGILEDNLFSLLEPLKYAIRETEKISEYVKGKYYLETEVTSENITETLRKTNVVHLSAHALIRPENIIESCVLLYPDDENKNYFLSYLDVLQMHLNNELITLSTCQSSEGQLIEQEGLLSLARAFIQSGAQSVVGNTWDTRDLSAMKLMSLFYQDLKGGNTTPEALRKAKLAYLSDEEIKSPTLLSPHHWAGWKVYGCSTPFKRKKSGYIPVIVSLCAIVLLGSFLYRKHKKTQLR